MAKLGLTSSGGLWALCNELAAAQGLQWATWDSQRCVLPRLWEILGGARDEAQVEIEVSASFLVTRTALSRTALETLCG